MRAISVRQPWAGFIIDGLRPFEIRTWTTDYRGPIVIHVPQKLDKKAFEVFRRNVPNLDRHRQETGVLLGCVDIVGSLPFTRRFYKERLLEHKEFEPWKPGQFALALKNPRRFRELIPWHGRQRFFSVPDSIVSLGPT